MNSNCELIVGPCTCGAWHSTQEVEELKMSKPLYRPEDFAKHAAMEAEATITIKDTSDRANALHEERCHNLGTAYAEIERLRAKRRQAPMWRIESGREGPRRPGGEVKRPVVTQRTPILHKTYFGVICRFCMKILVSWTTHDCKTCGCPNEAMIDGGRDYIRCGAANLNDIELVRISPIKPRRGKKK